VAGSVEWYDLAFRGAYVLDDPAEAALEDYARVLGRAEEAEAVKAGDARVGGLRLLRPRAPVPPEAVRDIEDFARDLAARGGGSGLGWA
jgi:hypothetical protein